jgi:hypothetical protein
MAAGGGVVPRGTPLVEVDRLREAVARVMRQADFRDRFQVQGLVIQAPRLRPARPAFPPPRNPGNAAGPAARRGGRA